MSDPGPSRLVKRPAMLLFATLFLASCNNGTALAPKSTTTHSLVGTKSGNLRVVESLKPPKYIESGESQLIFKNDLLTVDVFQVDELDRTVRVNSRGTISMPLIGTVRAAQRSVPDLEQDLKRKYGAKYLRSPEISVFVKESSGQKVVLDGAFKRPGSFATTSQTTLLRVVAEAGGLLDIADEKKLFIYRNTGPEIQVAQYSVAAIRKGNKSDPRLYAGDVVVAFQSSSKVAFKNIKEALGVAGSAARVVLPY